MGMWIPKDEAELISVVTSGGLEESETFDAKRNITDKNIDIATDIAAMSTNGGVIIYGIDEDEHERPTILSPIDLAGQSERISSIARTSIDEPLSPRLYPIEKSDEPGKGYLVVEIPPSPRAPHQVLGRKHRFYGRSGKTNIPLTQGEIARLYARRTQMEVDRERILQEEIARYEYEPEPTLAYQYAFVRPVFPQTDAFLNRLNEGEQVNEKLLKQLIIRFSYKAFTREDYSPKVSNIYHWRPTVDGIRGDTVSRSESLQDLSHLVRLEVDHNGNGHLFCGRAAEEIRQDNGNRFFFFPSVVAGNVSSFLYVFGSIYQQAHYYGMVDIGVSLTGLKGCYSYRQRWYPDSVSYEHNEYSRTLRCDARELIDDTKNVASQLVMPLIRAVARGDMDPFA